MTEGVKTSRRPHWLRWLRAALIRAVRTMAQTAAATLSASAVLAEVDWGVLASAAALAGLLSLMTSLAGLPEVRDEDEGPENP